MERIFFQDRSKDYKRRLDMDRFLDKSEDHVSLLNSAVISQIKQIEEYEIYQVSVEEKAPDYIALLKYRSHAYWWIIMVYNNLLSFDEIVPGMTLRLPSQVAIDNILNTCKLQETQVNNGIYNISLNK